MKSTGPHWINILKHLGKHTKEGLDFIGPYELTQNGIAESVGISRAHVSMILTDRMDKSLIDSRLVHIPGISRRRKIYFLTWIGYMVLKKT